MAGKQFYEVLEEQIRAELRKEIEAEIRAELDKNQLNTAAPGSRAETQQSLAAEGAAGRLETWLATHVKKTHFSPKIPPRTSYRTSKAPRSMKPQPIVSAQPTPPNRFVATSVEDLCRIELLRRHGAMLGDSFTAEELKTAWRRVALKTHPDRFAQADTATQLRMSAVFREITEAYGQLAIHFESDLQAA